MYAMNDKNGTFRAVFYLFIKVVVFFLFPVRADI